jgi:hypothetical protein
VQGIHDPARNAPQNMVRKLYDMTEAVNKDSEVAGDRVQEDSDDQILNHELGACRTIFWLAGVFEAGQLPDSASFPRASFIIILSP